MTVSAEEFLRRFLVHVLPRGFVKIRHYGLLANRRRDERLLLCRRLLLPLTATTIVADAGKDAAKAKDAAVDLAALPHCPRCSGSRFQRFELPAEVDANAGTDTS
jgi:hypothetical protein